MAEVGFEIDLAARVWQMTLAQRQQLELLRTLAIGARILILDEPPRSSPRSRPPAC